MAQKIDNKMVVEMLKNNNQLPKKLEITEFKCGEYNGRPYAYFLTVDQDTKSLLEEVGMEHLSPVYKIKLKNYDATDYSNYIGRVFDTSNLDINLNIVNNMIDGIVYLVELEV